MKNYETLKVRFENQYYNIVRSVVDNFRIIKVVGFANGKGLLNSGILVEEDEKYTTILFRVRNNIGSPLCKMTLNDLQKYGLIVGWQKLEESN